jgi:flagella basal body P-ring formation protein FlgA
MPRARRSAARVAGADGQPVARARARAGRNRAAGAIAGLAAVTSVGLAWLAGPAAAGVVVHIPPEVVVRTEDVRLGDIAQIEGDARLADRLRAVRLGSAPVAGRAHHLDLDLIRLRLRQQQIDPAKVEFVAPDRVAMTRAIQVLTGQALLDAAMRQGLEHLERLDPHGGPYALVPVSRPGDLRLPAGETELAARIDAAPPYTALAATVAVRVDGREQQVVPLSFRIGRYQPVVISTRAMPPATPVALADVTVQSRVSAEVPAGAVESVAELADMEVARTVKPGDVLTRRLLRPRMMVRRGEVVTLSFVGRGFRVTTLGRALEDAKRGDLVRVVNPTSRREVVGTADGPGLVRVGPE